MKHLKTQKQLNEESENLNISDVSGSVWKINFLINGSGLFFLQIKT